MLALNPVVGIEMAKKVTLYKVFIGSPSDVNEERERFKNVIALFNERYAIKHDAIFMPVYWEQNTGGMLHPQDKANHRLDECDYALIVFGKKWGTKPKHATKARFTSGTEEEFKRAVSNYNDDDSDMNDVVVVMKQLPADSEEDPGYNAKRIITFKKKLRKNGLSYLAYVDANEFASILDNHLSEWLDNHIKGGGKIQKSKSIEYDYFKFKHIEHIPFPGEQTLDKKSKRYKRLKKAGKLADQYMVFEAQEIYESIIEHERCLPALNDYAKFLFRIGELSNSEHLFAEIVEVAKFENNFGWMARATANLAMICLSRCEHDKAISLLHESLEYNQNQEHSVGIADNHRHLSNAYRLQGNLDIAEEHIQKSIDIFNHNNVYSGLADSHADYGVILRIRGQYSRSLAHYDKALKINIEHTPEKQSCRADYIDRLGTVHRIRGNLASAEKHYLEALTINENLSRRRGEAEVLGHLGLVEFYFGNFEEAFTKLEQALVIDRQLNNRDGIAKHLASKARVFHWQQKRELAYDSARQSLDINRITGSIEGLAYSLYILGSIQYSNKEITRAEKSVEEALMLWQKLKGAEGKAECLELKSQILHSRQLDRAALEVVNEALVYCQESGASLMESSLLVARANINSGAASDVRRGDLEKALAIATENGEIPKMNMIHSHLRTLVADKEC